MSDEALDKSKALGIKIQAQGDKAKQMLDDINSGKIVLTPGELKQALVDILAMIQIVIKG